MIKFFLTGILFGVILTKSEVVSWLQIYDMFHFRSFHMYGVIGSAVITGMILIQLVKKLKLKNIHGLPILLVNKEKSMKRYLFGGIIFGLGWAITGACPGPMFILLGNGFWIMIIPILSAILGTFLYGLIKDKLPH